MGKRSATWLGLALAVGLPGAGATAAESEPALCDFLVHHEAVVRDDLALQLELARSDFAAAEEIFKLLDGLWREKAVERLRYLTGKHQRDVARLEVRLAEQRLVRMKSEGH